MSVMKVSMNKRARIDKPDKPPPHPHQSSTSDGLLHGWRLGFATVCISMIMFLVNIEVSVVATALVSVVEDLDAEKGFGWVVTGYLVTYTSFILLWSKFSNVFGRKASIIATMAIFTIFSAACAGARNLTQLIAFRALQGIGAAGCNSVGLTIAYEMVPQHQYPKYTAIVSFVSSLGSLLGPIIGGGFGGMASWAWRWIFLINVPFGVVVLLLLIFVIPNGFPYQNLRSGRTTRPSSSDSAGIEEYGTGFYRKVSIASLAEIDLLGAFFLLASSLMFVSALLGAGTTFAWTSATTIVLFICSGLLLLAFLGQEWHLSKSEKGKTKRSPIFPWEYFGNREWMGTLLLSMFSGAPYIVTMIDIPQRYQTSNISALSAGIRLIPFNFMVAFGAVIVNVLAGKTKIPPIVLVLFGAVCQLIGVSLLAFMKYTTDVPSAIYGYQVVLGLGIGFVFGINYLLPSAVIKIADPALSAGAVLQFRILGGALGLAIASNVQSNYARSHLKSISSSQDLSFLLDEKHMIFSIELPAYRAARTVLIESYNARMRVLIVFAALQFLAMGMLWRFKGGQIEIPKAEVESDKEEFRMEGGKVEEEMGEGVGTKEIVVESKGSAERVV